MTKSYFAIAGIAISMMATLVACDGESSYERQLVYFETNRAYIREKKTEKDANGAFVYTQLISNGDTALYRVLSKVGDETGHPSFDTKLTLNLEGKLINDAVFQKRTTMELVPNKLIKGLGEILQKNTVGETIEAIIPATLGYGYNYQQGVPAGSTLIFNYTIEK